MNAFLGILGLIWSSPYTILSYVLFLFLWMTGQVEKIFQAKYLITTVDLKNEGWFYRLLFENREWGSLSFGGVSFVVDTDEVRWKRTVLHGQRHSLQCYWFGLLFIPAYILSSIFIYLFMRRRHSYYDNPFEKDAREAAGQPVHIPKERWKDGPMDRWAFW